MSKRYREALQEVETHGTRARAVRAARGAADAGASAEAVEVDRVDARASAEAVRVEPAVDAVDAVVERGAAVAATTDPVDPVDMGSGARSVPGSGDGASGGRGGVATLVRPVRSGSRADPSPHKSDDQPTTSPDRSARHPEATMPRPEPGPTSRSQSGPASRPESRPESHPEARPGNGPADADEPLAFAWRGRRYDVTRILGHWREEEGWWRRPDGEPIRIEQSDLWRVEAVRGGGMARDHRGVYELSRRGVVWRLDRVWD
ncbi:MAG TPA: DUF6504 family protein [Nitriliruptoraceae bacterium]|nr:DUF6504 family protein [Nitriliruptoraceae bacterium]